MNVSEVVSKTLMSDKVRQARIDLVTAQIEIITYFSHLTRQFFLFVCSKQSVASIGALTIRNDLNLSSLILVV